MAHDTATSTATGTATNRIEEACRARGIRLTGPRRLIAEVLAEARDHPDAAELHRRVSARDPRVAVATVYRTVKRLEREGIIERHAFGDGRARYEPGSGHHDHLIDVETGRVIEFSHPEIERLQAEIAAAHGYELVGHRLELYARRRSPPGVRRARRAAGGDRRAGADRSAE